MAILEEEIVQTLLFIEQPVKTNQILIHRIDTLLFYENDDAELLHAYIEDRLIFRELTKYTLSAVRSISQTLNFNQGAFRNRIGDVYENLVFSQTADGTTRSFDVTQVLAFTQSVNVVSALALFDSLTFAETVRLNFIRVRSVTDTLSYHSRPVYFKPDYREINQPIQNIIPVQVVSFAYGNIIIYIRPPDFGNSETIGYTRIQRETRGGDLTIFKDPIWTFSQTLDLTFSWQTDEQARYVQNFVRGCLGQLISYTDHESNQWTGFFNSPDFEIQKVGRNNNTFTLKFEVVFI